MIKSVMMILTSFSVLFAAAQTSGIEQEFKAKLKSVSDKNSTISCDFTQTKKVKNITKPIDGHGQFFYDNSGLMALIYIQPKGDRVIMNGEQFMVVAGGKKMASDASTNPIVTQISFMMQACMSGSVANLGRGWDMSVTKNAGCYKVQLTPTDKRLKRYISGMEMLFDEENMTLNQLRIDESSGGYTQYNFVNKRINQKIDNSCFKVE